MGGSKLNLKSKGPAATTTSQIMDYFTVNNIQISTSYQQGEWAEFVLKELIDNAYEWLNDHYPANKNKPKQQDEEIRKIYVRIWVTILDLYI